MLQIVEGSLEEAKEEMKSVLKTVQARLSKYKRTVKPSERTGANKEVMDQWESFIHFFRVSEMAPVFVGDICINYKLYQRFMKKLKGYQVECFLNGNKLTLYYSNNSHNGKLELYNISYKLEGMKFFPRAVIVDE
ncbi:hypothetical protein [Virgibacillus sp. MG-45]|uniref:hypothetical protein n=1 Tax=Virgibacillus sp. MG-45 TaxID=3102791 RepID=UPI002ED77D62